MFKADLPCVTLVRTFSHEQDKCGEGRKAVSEQQGASQYPT